MDGLRRTHTDVLVSLAFVFFLAALPVSSDEANVLSANIKQTSPGTYRISVEVQHDDTGWDHYANGWDVLGPNDEVLATRVLAHPHVNEQPFTRSKSGIKIPADITEVTLRARDSVHDVGGKTVTLAVPR